MLQIIPKAYNLMIKNTLLLLSSLAISPLAFADVELSDLTYTNDGSSVTITDCLTTASGALVVPSTINNLPVTTIGDSAFRNCQLITSVQVPEGITSLEQYAFYNCDLMETISLPDSLQSIGYGTFSRSEALTSISLPGISTIPNEILTSCTSLHTVTFGEGTTSIGNQLFLGCDNLTTVNLPSSLQSVTAPTQRRSDFTGGSFFDATALTQINVTASNTNFSSSNGALYTANQAQLLVLPAGITGAFSLHSNTSSIAAYAFNRCYKVNSLHIGSSISTIDPYYYNDCTSLTSFTVDVANPSIKATDGVIFSSDDTQLLCYPTGKSGDYTIPDGVTSVAENAFYERDLLTAISTPSSLTSIGDSAFSKCSELVTATINGTLTELPSSCFNTCAQLTTVTLSPSIVTLQSQAFSSCRKLNSINLSNITTFSTSSLSSCHDLSSVTLHPQLTSIPESCFESSGLTELTLPSSITSIGDEAFAGSGLYNVSIPGSVTFIGDYAFYDSENLTHVTFEEGFINLSADSFAECYNLESVIFPSTLTSLGGYCFGASESLKYVLFKGNAPTLDGTANFDDTASDITLYYYQGATGFASTLDEAPTQVIDSSTNPAAEWLTVNGLAPLTDAETDPNGDGVSLLMEYALDLSPTDDNSTSMPQLTINGGNAEISYFANAEGINYLVEKSTDLTNWSSTGVTLSALDSDSIQTASISTDEDAAFLKLTVQ